MTSVETRATQGAVEIVPVIILHALRQAISIIISKRVSVRTIVLNCLNLYKIQVQGTAESPA